MARSSTPLITLDPGGTAPIISYNVPEPTTYTGRNFIELPYDEMWFLEDLRGGTVSTVSLAGQPIETVRDEVQKGLSTGFAGGTAFPNLRMTRPVVGAKATTAGATTSAKTARARPSAAKTSQPKPTTTDNGSSGSGSTGTPSASSSDTGSGAGDVAETLDDEEVSWHLQMGDKLVLSTNILGTVVPRFVPAPVEIVPRFVIVESWRLSSFLGQYGAGRVLSTTTLLPGEKTSISIKTYRQTESTSTQASSIFDSVTETAADEFQTSVENEQSSKETYDNSFNYYADAEASASWGWGKASVQGGVSGSTNSSREESAKNVSTAASNHAQTASAQRDVTVDTSYQVTESSGEETSIVREIQNINVSRTLNFVFRQMNQEFITLIHLVDLRVAFYNNDPDDSIEVPLSEIDTLLATVMVSDAAKQLEVKNALLYAVQNIMNRDGNIAADFVRQKAYREADGTTSNFWHVNTGYVSTYLDPATGTSIVVPGVILSATKNVLRTEGVIVEALLGQAEALDWYNLALQDEAVAERKHDNRALDLQSSREELAQKIVRDKDATAADLFAKVFPPPVLDEDDSSDA